MPGRLHDRSARRTARGWLSRKLLLATTLSRIGTKCRELLSLAGIAVGQVAPVPSGQERYLVELTPEAAASVDARTLVSELAATYGGTVEPQSQAGRFVIDILAARAAMLTCRPTRSVDRLSDCRSHHSWRCYRLSGSSPNRCQCLKDADGGSRDLIAVGVVGV